ncbi:hypothetical protein JF66_06690 [Cryobacterium sp. MLB-32]|uniref:hypothetical protein n=1 Tax=Cryobacterium sp. MLB-32 TaxID=1529318 RepID=UPI0004E736AE|nr:hypothetical protein [Cryobacterium sp. MLB-32]KFF60096.1 hypothetical protein JF66_06690 [Cryobacterium sp. MLB-32]
MAVLRTVNFSSDLIAARVIDNADEVSVQGPAIVVNVSPTPAFTAGSQPCLLPPFSSTIVTKAQITGTKLLVVGVGSAELDQDHCRNEGWTDFYGTKPGAPVLLKSRQDSLGAIELDCGQMLGNVVDQTGPSPFEVRANLWFSPAGTDCGIHNQHDFIEVHTQVHGHGRMQKFMSDAADTIYEDQLLSPGNTNPTPFCVARGGSFQYPWHQYRADSDCVWLAVEYHRV